MYKNNGLNVKNKKVSIQAIISSHSKNEETGWRDINYKENNNDEEGKMGRKTDRRKQKQTVKEINASVKGDDNARWRE